MSPAQPPLSKQLNEREQVLKQGLAACTPYLQTQEDLESIPSLTFHYLHEALRVNSPSTFTSYLQWQYAQDMGQEKKKDIAHQALTCIYQVLARELPDHELMISDFIDASYYLLQDFGQPEQEFPRPDNPLGLLAKDYLQALLHSDRRRAKDMIHQAIDQGTSIRDIYLHVFQSTQYEIGRLWQINRATVAQEHFCTALTQGIMSQLYEHIFAIEHRGRSLVATCVGGELHELGMRMVTDFFEMDGWDTAYLGARSSTKDILQSVDDRQSEVVAISATMSFHVRHVEDLIAAIRTRFGSEVKILVGGHPFLSTTGLWRQVGADAYGINAQEAVAAANAFFNPANPTA